MVSDRGSVLMLELIAQVEPMSLPLWAVLAISAAMYPLGFMLGAPCSACCCPPCSRCTHFENAGGGCPGVIDLFSSLTFEVGEYGNDTITNPGNEPSAGCFEGHVSLPVEDLPDIGEDYNNFPCVFPFEILTAEEVDSCGCTSCCFSVGFRSVFEFGNDQSIVCGVEFTGCLNQCSETEITLSAGAWELVDNLSGVDPATILSFLNSLTITASLSIPACDCGACCDNGCEENVAEGGCAAWQGVGTDCNPDPCV